LTADGHLLLNLPINEVWDDPNHVRRYSRATAERALAASEFQVDQVVQADRVTAWLISCDLRASGPIKVALKFLRVMFALLPVSVLDALESVLLQKYEPQQLLILARKV
jgi:hypothetical protein